MTDYERQLLKYIVRQNDLMIERLSMVLDLQGHTLERTFQMADEVTDLVSAVEADTEIDKATALIIDHAVTTLDDIKAKLDAAGTDKEKLRALSASIRTNSSDLAAKKDELAAAVTRNTPFDSSANA